MSAENGPVLKTEYGNDACRRIPIGNYGQLILADRTLPKKLYYDLSALPDLSLLYFQKVDGLRVAGETQTVLRPNHLYASEQSTARHLVLAGGSDLQAVLFSVDREAYLTYLQDSHPDLEIALDLGAAALRSDDFPVNADMLDLLRQVLRYRGRGPAAQLYYENKFHEFFALLAADSRAATDAAHQTVHPEDRLRLAQSCEYIAAHIQDDPSLAETAAAFLMSRSKYKRLFHLLMNCTFSEYKDQVRLSLALRLFDTTDLTISDVAARVGYKKADSFRTFFRKQMHMTPSEYCALHRAQP